MPNVYLAADHAGFELKERIKASLSAEGHTVTDCGAVTLVPGDDYPDYITPCARQVAGDAGSFGIVIGGSGQGEAIAANRVPGVRAIVYYGPAAHPQVDASGVSLGIIEGARAHNHANVLSLGARFVSSEEALQAVQVFLTSPVSPDDHHVRRVGKLG